MMFSAPKADGRSPPEAGRSPAAPFRGRVESTAKSQSLTSMSRQQSCRIEASEQAKGEGMLPSRGNSQQRERNRLLKRFC